MSVVAIAGASGFVGRYLQDYFYEKNVQVIVINREVLLQRDALNEQIAKADVIINLAGENILQRWSQKAKKKMYRSRIESTKALVEAINATQKKQLFISTSAIGIYENDIACDEEDFIYGQTFLTELCKDWEREASKVTKRLAIFRLGVVLGKEGALKKMLVPFKLGIGGKIGDGKQPFSFIYINDLARAYEHIIYHDKLQGIFNLTTPHPVSNASFTKALAKRVHKPAFIPLPVFALKLLYGAGAQVLTQGQIAIPKRLLESGFSFRYSKIEDVLEALV